MNPAGQEREAGGRWSAHLATYHEHHAAIHARRAAECRTAAERAADSSIRAAYEELAGAHGAKADVHRVARGRPLESAEAAHVRHAAGRVRRAQERLDLLAQVRVRREPRARLAAFRMLLAGEYDETKHPRDKSGQWTSGGDGGTSPPSAQAPAHDDSTGGDKAPDVAPVLSIIDWKDEGVTGHAGARPWHKMLAGQETRIIGQKFETAVAVQADSLQFVLDKDGEGGSVRFTKEETARLGGGVLTHNHPDGQCFSDDDIHLALSRGLTAIRVVGMWDGRRTAFELEARPRQAGSEYEHGTFSMSDGIHYLNAQAEAKIGPDADDRRARWVAAGKPKGDEPIRYRLGREQQVQTMRIFAEKIGGTFREQYA